MIVSEVTYEKKMLIISIIFHVIYIYLPADEYLVNSININGLSRTRYTTVLEIIELEEGALVNSNTPAEISQNLIESGIFRNNLTVELNPVSDTEAVVTINLAERWTFLPLPAGFVSSDKWLAGGVLIESNLAGLNQTLVSGAFLTNNDFTGFIAWNNPAFFGSEYSVGISLSGFDGLKNHFSITGEDIIASSEQTMLSSRLRMGRSYSSGFSFEASSGIMNFKTDSGTGYLSSGEYSRLYWQNSLKTSWDDLYYISFFNSGPALNLINTIYSDFSTGVYEPVVELELSHSFLIANRHLFKGIINSGWQNRTDFNPLFIGGKDGSRALPSGDVAVESFISGLVTFEPVVFTPGWGVFTLPLYYEAGIYSPLLKEKPVAWHGPGFGFRFYIDKVAIPALGADFTWNLNEETFRVVVSVGGNGGAR